jgi:dipeptidyl aminopeptidase/acylaminoacyl peptidase
MTHTRRLAWLLALAVPSLACAQDAKLPFTVQDLVRIKRLADPHASPDGRYVAFTLRETDMEANQGRTGVWLLDLSDAHGVPHQLAPQLANDSSPRWAPDSRTLYFLSDRSGSKQVWRIAVTAGAAQQVTRYPLDVGTLQVSPAGDRLALSLQVLPDCRDLECTHARLTAHEGKPAASGQLYERLFVRHWDTWSNGTRSHLFSAPLLPDGSAGTPVDLSAALDADIPSKPFGTDEDYDFSPDGRTLAFSARIAGSSEAWSTNFDVYEVPVDGAAAPRNLTADNPAWDAQPRYLKNGDLAYLAMERPGFEADRFHVVLLEKRTGKKRPLTQSWDRSVSHLIVNAERSGLFAIVDEVGQHALYALDMARGTPKKIVGQGEVDAVAPTRKAIVFALASLSAPADLYAVPPAGGGARQLTQMNAALLAQRAMSASEQFSFPGWSGQTVYGYVTKPFGWHEGGRYPLAFVVHGGPQSSMGNDWSYRWNPQVFAAAGYGVVFVDFHGSPGYGQAFTDSISGDWGGKPLEDLQKGLAAALARYPWLDGTRVCALGASYGGYMINWIAGQWPDRFRCLVSHDGVFELHSMYYSTEELWFPEWEQGGPYYEVPQNYEKFSPANHVTAWRTPMLVIHGGLDYRVPLTQGLGVFTALQRRGIESRFLYFPDENHWVLKPDNSIQWYDTVIGWLDQHLK